MLKKNYLATNSVYVCTEHSDEIINEYFELIEPLFYTISECEYGKDIDDLLNLGVDKVIVGTIAIENMKFLKDACEKYKNKIVVALDVRNGFIASSGWKKQTSILASEFVKEIELFRISRIIYTDINKDGTKTGPNIKDTLNFSKLTKIPVMVSGGISSINDIKSIKENFPNLYGVIVGKAIYDGTIDIRKLSKI